MTDVVRAFDADNHLGEGPIWSPDEQALWWVNCEGPAELHRWSPTTGVHDQWAMPARAGGFVPKADGGVLAVLGDGLYDFDPDSGNLMLRVKSPLPDRVLLHECHCDRQGRLWVGSYDHDFSPINRDTARGSYFRLDGNVLTPVIDDITVANGLAFSPDGLTLYAGNSPTRTVHAYDLDPESGTISNRRLFLELAPGEGHLDGATVDVHGGYWLAVVAIGQLRRYFPDGSLDRIIKLPFSNPTKPAFGGADMATLYLTSTKLLIDSQAPGRDANGPLYALRPGETGIAEAVLRA